MGKRKRNEKTRPAAQLSGDHLRLMIQAANLTIQEFADLTNTPVDTMYTYTSGRRHVPVSICTAMRKLNAAIDERARQWVGAIEDSDPLDTVIFDMERKRGAIRALREAAMVRALAQIDADRLYETKN